MKIPTTIKSPLRYPGGKGKVAARLFAYLPTPTPERIISPFLGGGGFELYCAAQGIKVHSCDSFKPLINFWRIAQRTPHKLAHDVLNMRLVITDKYFGELKHQLLQYDKGIEYLTPDWRAAAFYTINACSFGGLTLSHSYGMVKGHPRFTVAGIKRLNNFHAPNFFLTEHDITRPKSYPCAQDFEKTITDYGHNGFLYCDPPYITERETLYGFNGSHHRNFEHARLAAVLRDHKGSWMLSYNDCPQVRELYDGYRFEKIDWNYSLITRNDKRANEVLILNYEQ